PPHRLVVDPARARTGRADRRHDHAHAAQHDACRDGPHLVAGAAEVPAAAVRALRGGDRLGALLARAHRLHVPAAPLLDGPGLRRSAAEPGRARPLLLLLHLLPRRRRGHSPETLAKQLDGADPASIAKITHENAMRIYHYDPFAHRAADRCTVGALRSEVRD